MKILIAIPSKNRFDILQKNALTWVPLQAYDWQVFVEPQDFGVYASTEQVPEMKGHLQTIEQNDQGLGYANNFIKEWAKKNGYTHVFKVDDDVKGFTIYREKPAKAEMVQWFNTFTKDIEEAFAKYPDIKGVGFPYAFQMFEKKLWTRAKRMQTCYIVSVDDWFTDPKVSVFEDFAVGISIIAKGGLIMQYGMAGIDMGVKVGGGTGGHQSFDRSVQATKEMEELWKIYPPLRFRSVDKPWKIEPDLRSVTIHK